MVAGRKWAQPSAKARPNRRTRDKAIRSLEKQLENLKQMRLLDHIPEEEYVADRRKLMVEKEALLKGREEEKRSVMAIEPFKRFLSFVSLAQKRFAEGDQKLRRKILVAMVSNLFVKDRKVFIEAKKPFQLLLERPRSPVWSRWLDDIRTSVTEEVMSGGLADIPDLSEESLSHKPLLHYYTTPGPNIN